MDSTTSQRESESVSLLETSPMMSQWIACKKMAPQSILLFRLGDFYEGFHEDALILSKELDLTLTKRHDVPMSGIPFHTVENYIDRLVSKGYRVAIAEQTEDARKAKGLVKREVVRVVTPGTLINSTLLSERQNNFFACICRYGHIYGLAFIDLTTSEFWTTELADERELLNELYRLQPAEILLSDKFKKEFEDLCFEFTNGSSTLITTQEEWYFDYKVSFQWLLDHFKVLSLDGFGLQGYLPGVISSGVLLKYLKDALSLPIDHILDVRNYSTSQYMQLDQMTQKNLELSRSLNDHTTKNTLLSVLDKTLCPMGGRLLHQWLKQPLLDCTLIKQRQGAIHALLRHLNHLNQLREKLNCIKDLERLMMKISSGYASPKDVVALKLSFEPIPEIKTILVELPSEWIQLENNQINSLDEMIGLISKALVENPPLRLGEGKVFNEGYHEELDELRSLTTQGKDWIARYQTKVREETGIKTLKIGFNKMFGYYLEASRGQADKIPDHYIRRQTLVNAERYITPELKAYESKVLTAEDRISVIENELFNELRLTLSQYTHEVLKTAQAVAKVDVVSGLAEVARLNCYTCPDVNESSVIQINEGRHPVIEVACKQEKFIPNDTRLDDFQSQLLLITGPNMAGKSTYLRQVALIIIMAQIGSFVPVKSASIGIVDKVYARIGASDDISRGRSTFMVEMYETAKILNTVTSRSLVILDEIGRGTSTYDGISIAWSVAEYLLTTPEKKAKTLFATHYWELTKLEEKIPGALNYHVAVHEAEDTVVFLRKIVKGGTDKSYGIHVAKLAGLPQSVIQRANEILSHLEANANQKGIFEQTVLKKVSAPKVKVPQTGYQLTLF